MKKLIVILPLFILASCAVDDVKPTPQKLEPNVCHYKDGRYECCTIVNGDTIKCYLVKL